MVNLKWYYDENRMFLIEATLKYRQEVYIRRKMPFTIFEYLFSFQRYSSFQNMQISQVMMQVSQVMMSYTVLNQILLLKIWWKKDISTNLYQKCLILCSKILLKVLHNMSLKVLLPWQHTGFQTSPVFKAFLATFSLPLSYLQIVPCMHDLAGILIS